MKTKELIVTLFLISSLLIIYGFFPVKNNFQQITVMIVFFIVIPIVFNKFILKKKIKDIGLAVGDWRQGLIWGGISIIVVGVCFFVAIYFLDFLKHYTIPSVMVSDYKKFILYEFLWVVPVIFVYDFFFRGFIMETLGKRWYHWAIIMQVVFFLILVIMTNSFAWRLVPYLICAPLAGVVVYKSKSIFYSTVFQFIIIIILDASTVRLLG